MHRLLFLPGAGADSELWRPVADRLSATWAIDLQQFRLVHRQLDHV
jgi:hypothetical protein